MTITFRGGRLPQDPRAPRVSLTPYLAVSAAPASVDYYTGIPSIGMLGNDEWGDCTCAGDGHIVEQQTWFGLRKEQVVSTAQALAAYTAISGFDPNAGPPDDNPTDRGATVESALNYLRKHGIGGFKIAAYGEVPVDQPRLIKQAVYEFGCLSIGMDVPESAMTQFEAGKPWVPVKGSPVEGGHCVIVVGYDLDWIYVITWGAVQRMSWSFWNEYVQEAHAPIAADWESKSGAVSLEAFGEEFAEMFGGDNPFPEAPASSPPSFLQRIGDWLAAVKRP
jgi:hypothetical protein